MERGANRDIPSIPAVRKESDCAFFLKHHTRSEKTLEHIKSGKYSEKYMNSVKKIILIEIGYPKKEISCIREEI